ncbi:MAG: hypothetical protein ACI9N0_001350 [Ilumatobacter sp.]|jgi:hypothetical protein
MGFAGLRRLGAVVSVFAGLLVATVVAVAVAGPAIDARGASASEAAVRLAPPPPSHSGVGAPALLISDSAWLGMYLYGGGLDTVQGFEHTLALASCRRRVVTSCTNYDGYVPITLIEELKNHPVGFATLIVATGYNDDDRAFRNELDTIIAVARNLGYERVVWLTLRSNVTYVSPGDAGFAEVFGNNNEMLVDIAASGAYPELFIADWAVYARDQSAWFSGDGIHLRRRGSYAAGDYVSRKMAYLDQRACPQPLAQGGPVFDPCPDPDIQGPLVDLDSLYPVDQQPQPSAPFLLNFEGSGSWPAPPWWES